jgi:hypothetical protein
MYPKEQGHSESKVMVRSGSRSKRLLSRLNQRWCRTFIASWTNLNANSNTRVKHGLMLDKT